ncbi:MAG: cbb3-type cytochrome c oxidase subunit 3 [Pseudomonadota bacterium]
MNATIFSLLAVTLGFGLLVAWVYWPSRRQKLEELGRIPLDGEDAVDTKNDTEQPHE